MDTITEENQEDEADVETTSPPTSPRIIKNKKFVQKTLANTRVKTTVNSEFTDCKFQNIVFQHLKGCNFTGCEFSGCAFQKDLIGIQFIQCQHLKSTFTEIRLQDCIFEKTALIDITGMFSSFDTCHFMDGELSSRTIQNCSFHNTEFERFNILTNTHIIKATFSGTSFDSLTVREATFSDTAFKNCSFRSVNQSLSQFRRCSFPYCSLVKCTYSDNKFLRCTYDHFVVKKSNILRNNFEGSKMDHTVFERSNFSYNNLSKGSFYNINFTFCTTRDNRKKDAVFCNSEMLTSTKMQVVVFFKNEFAAQDTYLYNLKLLLPSSEVYTIPDQAVTAAANAESLSFSVPYEMLNACYLIQIEKVAQSTFSSLFNYSVNEEEIFKYIVIDEKVFMHGQLQINGTRYEGFIPPHSIKKKRTNSL